ncbi:MAG: DUF418 domain-containing protein [Candidatus Eiseniibacteriota bacterium]
MTTLPQPASAARPIAASERLHALDAMRGVAILGVLVAYTVWSLGAPPRETWSGADHAIARGMDLLVDNKFLTMFACLFGVGIAQQWRRWDSAGQDPVPLHARRMAFLLGVGLLHAGLLRNGDILAPYALLGLGLLGFRRGSTRTLATAAVLLAATPYLVDGVMARLGWSWPERPGAVPGGYLAENFAWLVYWFRTNPFNSWPLMLALMLAGILIGRSRLIERMATSRALAGRVLVVASLLALLTRLALETLGARWTGAAAGSIRRAALGALFEVGSWTLAAAYGAGLLLVSRGQRSDALLGPLRALGRMAFTNYLLQGLIVVPLCLAFGLFDTMTPMRGLVMALAIAAAQAWFSTWWLERHPMGPLERVWRGVTYRTSAGGPGGTAASTAPTR